MTPVHPLRHCMITQNGEDCHSTQTVTPWHPSSGTINMDSDGSSLTLSPSLYFELLMIVLGNVNISKLMGNQE